MTIALPTQPVDVALFWAEQGWLVFPCKNTDKSPLTQRGFKDGMTDEAEIRAAWAKHPNALVGGATGRYRSVVDLDCKPGEIDGREVWKAVAHIDAPTVWQSRTPSGGIHRVYNKIENHPSIEQLPYFGFDIRNDGGYIILPGSVMADGRRYELIEWTPDSRAESIIDWHKIERVLKEEDSTTKFLWNWHLAKEAERKAKREAESRARRDALRQPTSPARSVVAAGQVYPGTRLVAPLMPEPGGGIKAEHPEAWARVLELVAELRDVPHGSGHGEISRICFEAGSRIVRHGQADLEATISAFQMGINWTYDKPGDEAKVMSDIDRCVRAGVDSGRGEPWRTGVRTTTAPPPPPVTVAAPVRPDAPPAPQPATEGTPSSELEQAPILLPDEFFDGCPELEIIRQAAYSRYVSPTALAMTVLTRIAAMADHKLRLPALVGSHVGLSFYTVLTAAVGGGKSSTVNLATELLGQDPTSTRQVEVINGNGTGEGLLQKHMEMIKEEGAKQPVPVQTVHNVFWYIDEGMNLVNEFERRGSNAAGILCTGWFSGANGNNNATGELNRTLAHLSYNWGILIAIQDGNAHHLLERQGIGLTQRCFWVSGNDPTIPDPDHRPTWPGSLDWRHPAMPGEVPEDLQSRLVAPAGAEGAPRHIKLPEWYHKEMEWALWKQKTRGGVDELSEHIRLMEIKLSVLVGMLRGRIDPIDDDIRRARLAIASHRKQVRRAATRTRLMEAENQRVSAQRAAEKAEAQGQARLQRFRDFMMRKTEDGKTVTWRKITQYGDAAIRRDLGGSDGLAEIVAQMMEEGLIRNLGGEGGATVYGRVGGL